jgi:hypothetical protein
MYVCMNQDNRANIVEGQTVQTKVKREPPNLNTYVDTYVPDNAA